MSEVESEVSPGAEQTEEQMDTEADETDTQSKDDQQENIDEDQKGGVDLRKMAEDYAKYLVVNSKQEVQ